MIYYIIYKISFIFLYFILTFRRTSGSPLLEMCLIRIVLSCVAGGSQWLQFLQRRGQAAVSVVNFIDATIVFCCFDHLRYHLQTTSFIPMPPKS